MKNYAGNASIKRNSIRCAKMQCFEPSNLRVGQPTFGTECYLQDLAFETGSCIKLVLWNLYFFELLSGRKACIRPTRRQ